jgi:methylenetetrahydrofolate reductase (NADH)
MTGTQRAGDMSADVTKLNFLANASIEATTKDAKDLRAAAPNLRPSSVFIPWLPGETFARRLEATCAVARQGFSPVVHIPARRLASQQDLQTQLSQLNAKAGASRLLLIGGDPATPLGPYPDTISVIRDLDLTAFNIKRVSLAGHPEDHPNMSRDQTLDVLHEKIAALSQRGIETEIVTQFSFDPDLVAAWVTTLRKSGLTCDIAIGVPGPTNVPKLMKFATRCGVGASAKAVAKYGFSLSRLFGKAGPDKFIDRFLQLQPDDRSLRAHFYPFGGFAETAAWLETQSG